jgi:predicted amidophosphoribosyltransferase
MLTTILQCLFPAKVPEGIATKNSGIIYAKKVPIILTKQHLQALNLQYIDQVIAVDSYHDSAQLQQCIKQCKYQEDTTKLQVLIHILSPIVAGHIPSNYVLTAVPMHWWYKWHRGFNQAECLAKGVASATRHEVKTLLTKNFRLGHQASRNRAQRLHALQHTFFTKGAMPNYVCIIDDVCTTGTTVNECAKICKLAGAKRVIACTILYSKPCEKKPTFVD